MTELTADNIETDTTETGQLVIEPSYVGYLREHGYTIESLNETHTVASESSDGAHLVVNITTYAYPKDDPQLDLIEHELGLWVCDCWSYRSNSTDVAEGGQPDGACKHIRQVSKVQNALADSSQQSL